MKYLRVEGEFHWGFWSHIPETSKVQTSLPIPPPTTLIGALAFPLISLGYIQNTGEIIVNKRGGKTLFLSSASLLENAFYCASIYYKGRGFVQDDINKYTTTMFHTEITNYEISEKYVLEDPEKIPGISDIARDILKYIKKEGYVELNSIKNEIKRLKKGYTDQYIDKIVKDTIRELVSKNIITTIPRRLLPKYRTGALITGKTYIPYSFVLAYLINEENVKAILGEDWIKKLELAAWNITRIGSKESIVSINDVIIGDAKEIKTPKTKTRFYFPASCGEPSDDGFYYREFFWRGGWGNDNDSQPIEYIEYIIPGKKSPLESIALEVEIYPSAVAYEIAEEEVLIYEKKF